MDHHTVRFIILALVIAVSVLRAIRRGTVVRPRSDSSGHAARAPAAEATRAAATGSLVAPASEPTTAPMTGAVVSPIEADAGNTPVRLAATLAAVLVWVAGNVALWLCLFEWPALAEVPKLWRFAALLFANIVLTALARLAAARVRALAAQPAAASANPIGE